MRRRRWWHGAFEKALGDLTEVLSLFAPRHFVREHPSDARIASLPESDL